MVLAGENCVLINKKNATICWGGKYSVETIVVVEASHKNLEIMKTLFFETKITIYSLKTTD